MDLENKVSVVIPTLGGSSLEETIKQLNNGSHIPDEILICIPKEEYFKVRSLAFDNIKIIETPFRGQVCQRAYGFERVSNDLVLQVDDDIILNDDCLEKLIYFILDHPGSSVGPKLIDRTSGRYHSYLYRDQGDHTLTEKISFYILNGKLGCQPGQLSKAGFYMGVPEKPDNWLNAGWLPGGCVLHRKENLVLENYYPVKGKAYWEDIFHADLLRKKGVLMHRVGEAVCTVDFSANKQMDGSFFVKEFLKILIIFRIYFRKNKISSTRIIIFHCFNTFTIVLRRLGYILSR